MSRPANASRCPATTKERFVPYSVSHGVLAQAIWLAAIVGLSLSFAALLLFRQQLEAHQMLQFEWVSHNGAYVW